MFCGVFCIEGDHSFSLGELLILTKFSEKFGGYLGMSKGPVSIDSYHLFLERRARHGATHPIHWFWSHIMLFEGKRFFIFYQNCQTYRKIFINCDLEA